MKNKLAFQQNVRASFHFVQEDVNNVLTELEKVKQRLSLTEENQRRMLYAWPSASVVQFVGDLQKREIHREDCLMITSIKNLDKVTFTNKFEAKQQGFNECICLY